MVVNVLIKRLEAEVLHEIDTVLVCDLVKLKLEG